MMESVKNRRTIRKYSDREVSDKLLNELLETSFRTPTLGNMQLYSIIVTRDADKKAELAPAHFNQPVAKNAPVLLTFCADFNRFCKWCEERKAEPGYRNFHSFFNAAMDALFAAQTFCNLAEEAGLGTCYLGTTTYNEQMIIDILGLPQLVFPVTTVTVGYPAECPEQPDRLPIEGIIHQESYQEYTPTRIDKLYKEKEQREDSRRFVQENNKETLAQVFTDVRYTRKDNEYFSENFMKILRRQGFLE